MSPLRFGIIGVGNIAPVHAAAIEGTPGARLVAVATRNPEHGRTFADEHGASWHTDYFDLLARPDVDAVAICTPHYLHCPMTVEASTAGKHVLCEKPMARTTAECDRMIAACRQAGVTLGVLFQGRFEPLSLRLKQGLENGQLGPLLWASANTIWHRTTEYYRSAPWRGKRREEGGGVLINQAIHAIDLLLWLAGMPARVTAQVRTLGHDIEVEDAALATLEWASGGLGLIQATTIAFPGYPERLEFFGRSGSAIYHKGQGRLEWHLADPPQDRVDEAPVSSGAARPMDITAAGHTAQVQDFVQALHEGRPPLVDGIEGRRSIALIEAIYHSARTNSPVDLLAE